MFEKIDYIVKDISGDYGILLSEKGETKVAIFFLPDEIQIGSKVIYENLEYRMG